MHPHVLALSLLAFPPLGKAQAESSREEDAWVDETGVIRDFAGPQEDLWLIRTER